ncbi:MAG: KpsF/GutQ family sugar-phosphate isomerase [Phycisphaerales bacterium]|nr:KpsF/GutQ family sugar-phosphate isomerase [Phycisphaerales bacterium]
MPRAHDPDAEREFARRILTEEAAAIAAAAEAIGPDFHRAVELVESCAGRGGTVLVAGLGKSGLIGAKIAATLTSLGIPAHFVHPTEAAHGDLGRFRPDDLCMALSNSGETDEVIALAAALRQDSIPIVAITGGPACTAPSSLQRLATVTLRLVIAAEAGGPDFIAPTSSTTAALALGDALALAAARRRNFSDRDFAKHHPGGSLGGLLRPIIDVLRFSAGRNLPLIPDSVPVSEALLRAAGAGRRPGAIMLTDAATGRLAGIFTDGDLRRLVLRDPGELSRPIRDVMTRSPRALPQTALVRDAVNMVREHRQDEIPIIDGEGRPVGLLDVQDLVAMRLVKD